jgi:hypothetical protein
MLLVLTSRPVKLVGGDCGYRILIPRVTSVILLFLIDQVRSSLSAAAFADRDMAVIGEVRNRDGGRAPQLLLKVLPWIVRPAEESPASCRIPVPNLYVEGGRANTADRSEAYSGQCSM